MSSIAERAPAIKHVLTVTLPLGKYTYMDSPDPLIDGTGRRCETMKDDEEKVIWLDPGVEQDRREQVRLDAACVLWVRQAHQIPVVC